MGTPYHDPRTKKPHTIALRFIDKIGKKLLGHFEIGDDAVRERAHDAEYARASCRALPSPPLPYRNDLVRFIIDRYHRGLVDNDASTAHIDKGIRGPEVNRDVVTEE